MNPKSVTRSPGVICPPTAIRAPYQTTNATNMPGRSTWAPRMIPAIVATATPARRTACERSAYRPENVSSPPMPRSTRRPATVSVASAPSFPWASRCVHWRFCSGLMSRATSASTTGMPTRTSRPSVSEERSRTMPTNSTPATDPTSRCHCSKKLPRWKVSLVIVARGGQTALDPRVDLVQVTVGRGQRRDDADEEDGRRTPPRGGRQSVGQPGVEGDAEDEGDGCGRDLADDPEQGGDHERRPLPLREPQQVPAGPRDVRVAGMTGGSGKHSVESTSTHRHPRSVYAIGWNGAADGGRMGRQWAGESATT
jgi:hypothetical protein